jgi:hypothetical protein
MPAAVAGLSGRVIVPAGTPVQSPSGVRCADETQIPIGPGPKVRKGTC